MSRNGLRFQTARQLEPVTHPKFRQDMGRAGRIGFQLLPQTADEYPKVLHLLGLRRSPDFAQQLAMRHHLAGMRHEMAEQLETTKSS